MEVDVGSSTLDGRMTGKICFITCIRFYQFQIESISRYSVRAMLAQELLRIASKVGSCSPCDNKQLLLKSSC